jgi:catechol 2,3-dioxygenase-like lactoylglutathione lyase family enzyme
MTVHLARPALDVGVVPRDAERALAFWRDSLGLPVVAIVPLPGVGTLYRLACGESFVKILALDPPPAACAPRGGYAGATGLRYVTLAIENLDEAVARCRADGWTVAVDVRPLRPGVRVAMIEDADGNTVELQGP